MYLIVFDIIESKEKLKLTDISDIYKYMSKLADEFYEYIEMNEKIKYEGKSGIQISGGDQIRVLLKNNNKLFELIFDVLAYLYDYNLKARVFISKGFLETSSHLDLNDADGDIFYKNKDLENIVKADSSYYRSKESSIRYTGDLNTELLDVLFLALSKLCLMKSENIRTLYYYSLKEYNQNKIAKMLGVSQVSISKRLKSSNSDMLIKLKNEIEKILISEGD